MEHIHFMWKHLYPYRSKCGFMFWVERHKHWTKTYIPTPWESIGYALESIEPSLLAGFNYNVFNA